MALCSGGKTLVLPEPNSQPHVDLIFCYLARELWRLMGLYLQLTQASGMFQ